MGVNKVVINRPTGEEVLIDLTKDSVIPEKLHKGFTAHNSKGEPIIGTYEAGNGEAEYTVWEKRTIGRHVDYYSMEFGESDTTTATVISYNDQHKRILYADYSFDEATGVVTLSNPLSTQQTSSADQVTNYEQYPYYYGDRSQGNTDNTVYKLTSVTSSGTSSYNKSYTWKFDKAIVSENGAYDIAGDLIETIADTNSTAYPDNGVQDGYWYIKAGSGEGGDNTGGTTEVKLQSKSATPSESEQTITPDAGYDGLSEVKVAPIPENYIVPEGTLEITETGTHDVKEYASVTVSIASGGSGLPDTIVAGDTPILASWTGKTVSATTITDTGLSITIPKDGTYRLYIPATKGSGMISSGNPTITVYKNGVATDNVVSVTSTTPTTPYHIDVECAEGDVIGLYATGYKASYSTTSVTVMALIACIDK